MFERPTNTLILEHDHGQIRLEADTLVVAIDDTGHEEFADANYPVFGLGGCAFLVRDYERLIATPWNYMCKKFFPHVQRPMHAVDIQHDQPTEEQLDALRHLFETFQFFRIATTVTPQTVNVTDEHFVNLVGGCMLNRIADVAKWVEFDRLFILVEESDRVGAQIMRSLTGKHIERNSARIEIELGTIPKSACEPALEVADFIIHTAGTQTRQRNNRRTQVRKDFEIIFKNVDDRLVSFMEITKAKTRHK